LFAHPSTWHFVLAGGVSFLLLLGAYTRNYSPGLGITKLLQVGQEFEDRGLGVFQATPKYIDPSSQWGFDGQFYAEISLDPLLRDSQLNRALDNPPYRARRILLSWLAWIGGLGQPFWILNVYTALNLVFWCGFAVMLGFLFRPLGWYGLAGFAAMLMTCGIIESMQGSLTDFPGFVLMALALVIGGARGSGVLALAALTREPNIIGLVGLFEYQPPWLATARRNLVLGLVAVLPIALWMVYVTMRFTPTGNALAGGNFSWPLQGIMAKLGEFSVLAVGGDIQWREWYSEWYANYTLHALLTIIAVLTQCIFLLTHREWQNRIWRTGAIFVPYFLCINYFAWESHFTVTRHALPITLAFNLVLALRPCRGWLVWFMLGNCFVPHGVYQFALRDLNILGSATPAEFRILADPPTVPQIQLHFGQGWADEEWTRKHTWRWSTAGHATLVITNPTKKPLEAGLAFSVRSLSPRDLKIGVRGTGLWETSALQSIQSVETSRFLLPPGQTVVDFESSEAPTRSDNITDPRQLSFLVQDLRIKLTYPRASR
jgi:hypothetical protein